MLSAILIAVNLHFTLTKNSHYYMNINNTPRALMYDRQPECSFEGSTNINFKSFNVLPVDLLFKKNCHLMRSKYFK